jgi:hypothetical protein
VDPDLGGPKTCGSGGSGSATLKKTKKNKKTQKTQKKTKKNHWAGFKKNRVLSNPACWWSLERRLWRLRSQSLSKSWRNALPQF